MGTLKNSQNGENDPNINDIINYNGVPINPRIGTNRSMSVTSTNIILSNSTTK